MKKIFLFSVLAASFLAASCESEFDPTVLGGGNIEGDIDVQEPSEGFITLSLNASSSEQIPEVKSLFATEGTIVKWGTGDIISLIDDQGEVHVSEPSATSAEKITFTFKNWPASRKPLYAIHSGAYDEYLPDDTFSDGTINTLVETNQVPSRQNSFPRAALLTVGNVVENNGNYSVQLHNICGLVKVTVTNAGKYSAIKIQGSDAADVLSGTIAVTPAQTAEEAPTFTVTEGSSSVVLDYSKGLPAANYYLCVLPGTIHAPIVTLVEKETGKETKLGRSDVLIQSGVVVNFGALDTVTQTSAVDLSAEESANCYVIDDAKGDYMFKAVKGNSDQSVGDVASAEVLWEDNYTNTAITSGAIISKVSVKDDHICFSIPEDRIPGNALIAAKDSEGKILWSWHIWVCNKGKKPADIKLTDDLILMDRNIGSRQANNAETSMLYQWGRKDPFPGQYGAGHPTLHTGTITVKASENNINDVARASISESIQNPTTLYGVYAATKATIWLETPGVIEEGVSATSTYLWGKSHTDKTIYDPCPAGYKVPHAWADPENAIPSSDQRDLAHSRFAALAGLEETATYASSVRTYTVADGSKLSFYATGWYLFGSTELPSLTYNTKTRDFHLWTASYQASQYAAVIDGNQSGISIATDASVWTKNNAYAVRCEKIQNK